MDASCWYLYGVDASTFVINSHLVYDFEQVTNSEKLERCIVGGKTALFALYLDLPGNASERHCTFYQNETCYFLGQHT